MLLVQDHEIIFPQASFITSKKQVTARPNYDPFQYLLNNTWVTDQPRFHVAISDDNNNWSLELPWPSESNPHTVIWTIERTDGSIIFGTVPEGIAGPVSVYQLLNTYNWSIQTGSENVFTPASLSQNADFSTINLSALSNQIFLTENGTLSWSPTLPRTITFPDVSGTVLTTGNLNAITGAITVDSLTVQTPNISTIGITVKGTLGQVADLQEWQDSTGAVLTKIGATGGITTTVDMICGTIWSSQVNTGQLRPASNNGTAITMVDYWGPIITNVSSIYVPLTVKSAPSQSADLQQWQDSTGGMLAEVTAGGDIVAYGNLKGWWITSQNASGPFIDGHSVSMTVYSRYAASVPWNIQGAPSQTADLQQWQDSTGAALAKIDASGNLTPNSIYLAAGQAILDPAHSQNFLQWTSGGAIDLRGQTGLTLETYSGPVLIQTDAFGAGLTNTLTIWLGGTTQNRITLDPTAGLTLQAQNGAGTTLIKHFSAAGIPLTVRGAPSQVSDLQQWQTSTGVVLAKVDFNGNFNNASANSSVTTSYISCTGAGTSSFGGPYIPGTQVSIKSASAGIPTLVLQGALSQTADLQEWQDSTGAVLARVDSGGNFLLPTGNGVIQAGIWQSPIGGFIKQGSFSIQLSGSVQPLNGTGTNVPIIVQGGASQTADLQQWQDSTGGTIFAKVTARGDIHTNVISASTTAPALIQFDNAAAFRIGDGFDGLQSASGQRTQLFGYWGLMLQGNIQNVLGAPTYVAGTADHFGVIIPTAWAGDVGLIVQGSPSQSADLQQWQDSTRAVLTSIDASGNLRTNNNIYGNYLQANQLFVYTSTATTLGLVIHGQASQTADLFQAQDSTNAVKARIDPSGAIAPQNGARITSGIGAPTTPGGINPTTGDFYLRTDGSAGTHIYFCSVGGATPTWVALV